MSVYFVSDQPIDFSELKAFKFKNVWVDEIDTDGNILLTDGINFLWCHTCSDADKAINHDKISNLCHVLFVRYASNEVEIIMQAIEEYFNISFIFESDERFNRIVGETD